MYKLIIDCFNFTLEHTITVVDASGETVGLVQLPSSEIAGFAARDSRISSITLVGPKEFCLGFKEQIKKTLATEYANRNIEIEVLEQ